MAIRIELTGDPARVLAVAGDFLAADPVRSNVILTLLHARVAAPREGRYAVARDGDDVIGVVFQSPLSFEATITPMAAEATDACVDALVAADARLPAITGDAGSAARFAGQWTERTKTAAVPSAGQRIYEAGEIQLPDAVPGSFRAAEEPNRSLLLEWLEGFARDAKERSEDAEAMVTRRIAAGQFWLWDHGGPVSMAAVTDPVVGVARIQAVYTPDELRGRGFASACVGHLSSRALAAGNRCILYTDLGNPISNSVYRRLGYKAVAEALRYEFR